MPFSQQIPQFRFLLDENVKRGLYKFLKQKGVDVKLAIKGSSDQTVQNRSKLEGRILVTNDEDFAQCTKEDIYGLILLKIPQNNETALLQSFNRLIFKLKSFASKLIVLYEERWDILPLAEEFKN